MNVVLDDYLVRAKQAMYLCFGGWVLALIMMLRLPDASQIDPLLLQPPLQKQISEEDFTFSYQGQAIHVRPVMSYVIYGLVVSHNDQEKWWRFDITHDSQSVNTRDVCLTWGANLQSNDFHRASFFNDDGMCNWSYGVDVQIKDSLISNNHLITDDDDIREKIADLQIGDQVAIKGKLVNYAEARWGLANLRGTSLSRDDTGIGSSEIIYVESLDILHSYNIFWAYLRDFCFWVCVSTLSFRISVFLVPKRGLHLPGFVRRFIALYKP